MGSEEIPSKDSSSRPQIEVNPAESFDNLHQQHKRTGGEEKIQSSVMNSKAADLGGGADFFFKRATMWKDTPYRAPLKNLLGTLFMMINGLVNIAGSLL